MTDQELRKYRNAKRAELAKRDAREKPEKTEDGATIYNTLYCTVYYTPRESGFTKERGFDATPVTAKGLGGRKYPRSFLASVKKEGFGRLAKPVNEKNYLRYVGHGRYAFAKTPLDKDGNPLIPRQSCAISSRNPHLSGGQKLRIESPVVEEIFGAQEWEATDTGGGVHPLQIDLYWGEDDPMGPEGRQPARPAGTRMEYVFDLKVIVKD